MAGAGFIGVDARMFVRTPGLNHHGGLGSPSTFSPASSPQTGADALRRCHGMCRNGREISILISTRMGRRPATNGVPAEGGRVNGGHSFAMPPVDPLATFR